MAKRKESASWKGGPTIRIEDADSKTVITLKKRKITGAEPVKIGYRYAVNLKRTNSKIYQATCTVRTLGSSSKIQDTIDGLSSDDDSDDEVEEIDSEDSTENDEMLSASPAPTGRGLDMDSSSESCQPKSETYVTKKRNVARFKSRELLPRSDEILKSEVKAWSSPSGVTGKSLFPSPTGCSTEMVKNDSSTLQSTDPEHEKEEIGCWLGDPHSHCDERHKIWVPLGDPGKVEMAEAISKNAARLAIHLLSVFFSREKIACGNCTPAPNRELLDQRVIHGIRLHLKHIYPVATTKEEEDRWKKILQTTLNGKCRNVRAALKLEEINRAAKTL
ncbi:hypothetical protein EMCRGX_G017030 [Ephydatia muelleri]